MKPYFLRFICRNFRLWTGDERNDKVNFRKDKRKRQGEQLFPTWAQEPVKVAAHLPPLQPEEQPGRLSAPRAIALPYLQHQLQRLPEEGEPHGARGQWERAAGVAAAHAVQVPELDGSQKE